jgi:hypothetical protein
MVPHYMLVEHIMWALEDAIHTPIDMEYTM